jgi:hypothetical protein
MNKQFISVQFFILVLCINNQMASYNNNNNNDTYEVCAIEKIAQAHVITFPSCVYCTAICSCRSVNETQLSLPPSKVPEAFLVIFGILFV